MQNFQCKKCGILIQANSTPPSTNNGCPKGGSHDWYDLGTVGTKNYQCKNCGTLIQANSTPPSVGCPKGYHDWYEL